MKVECSLLMTWSFTAQQPSNAALPLHFLDAPLLKSLEKFSAFRVRSEKNVGVAFMACVHSELPPKA